MSQQNQDQGKIMGFDSYGRELEEAKRKVTAQLGAAAASADCPATYDVVYDPEHPDADWAGLVSKEILHQKKHFSHKADCSIVHDPEAGLTTSTKVYGDRFDQRRVYPEKAMKQSMSSRPSIITGIPETEDCQEDLGRWKTSYQTQTQGSTTPSEALFEHKRPTIGRRRVPPSYDNPERARRERGNNDDADDEPAGFHGRQAEDDTGDSLIGYRAPVGRSLLAGLGSKLVTSSNLRPAAPASGGTKTRR